MWKWTYLFIFDFFAKNEENAESAKGTVIVVKFSPYFSIFIYKWVKVIITLFIEKKKNNNTKFRNYLWLSLFFENFEFEVEQIRKWYHYPFNLHSVFGLRMYCDNYNDTNAHRLEELVSFSCNFKPAIVTIAK